MRATTRFGFTIAVGLTTVLVAVLAGRVELLAFAAPFLVPAVAEVTRWASTAQDVRVGLKPSTLRVVEGDAVDVGVSVRGLDPDLSAEVTVEFAGQSVSRTIGGEMTDFEIVAPFPTWGEHRLGPTSVEVRSSHGLFATRGSVRAEHRVKVIPSAGRVERFLDPSAVKITAGSHPSRQRASGTEFADIRPHSFGDSLASVNWRATARRGELQVSDRHPDRVSDVVLFLDTFEAVGGSLDLAVQAAWLLAERHGRIHDRIGLLDLGGVFRWIPLGSGRGHLQRLTDALLATQIFETSAEKTIDIIPRRSLPPRAMVFVLSPLVDPRGIAMIHQLRRRGHDVAVLECLTLEHLPPATARSTLLAQRLWVQQRATQRARLIANGVGVTAIDELADLDPALERLRLLRRRVVSHR